MSSRIEQIIGEIEEYVDSCKFQPLSSTKIVVNKEELEELLRELRLKTPDEIKRYQKIISNKDAILADAQNKAETDPRRGLRPRLRQRIRGRRRRPPALLRRAAHDRLLPHGRPAPRTRSEKRSRSGSAGKTRQSLRPAILPSPRTKRFHRRIILWNSDPCGSKTRPPSNTSPALRALNRQLLQDLP